MPTLDLELQLHQEGKTLVAGIDEVGRGPLAGPVMAGAVILAPDVCPSESWLGSIKDSKKLSALQRERASKVVQDKALCTSLGLAAPNEIDVLGISKATRLAMLRAIKALPLRPEHLIIDFLTLEESNLPFTAVLRGDDKCYSIAAASIVAKVARDHLMVEANTLYPGYGFHIHKGYGTLQHLKSLQLLGPSPIHRFSFAPVRRAGQT